MWEDTPVEYFGPVVAVVEVDGFECPLVATDLPEEQALTPSSSGAHAKAAPR
jgi:hypothetical protein